MNYNVDEINSLIHNRRSIFPKSYVADKVVDDSVIEQMLENANWAPTHKLTEPWRFVVFTGDGLKKFAELQAACYKKVTQRDNSFKEERYQNLLSKPVQSSHIIAIGMKRDVDKRVREVEEVGAVFCAVQNMYLTATAYGVGCYLSTGGITYFEEAKELFGWNEEDKLIGFLHVGVVEGEAPSGRRGSVKEKTNWIK
ncbi:MAG: nitroreductase [Cyclobacteriaceae bacterium]|nr:nitroreductase [Cyclobacteriaceae bacterium]